MRRFSSQLGKTLKGIEHDALAALRRYHWPGNVRELQNVMERAVILSKDMVRVATLPSEIVSTSRDRQLDSRERLKGTERDLIAQALAKHDGNRRLTAAELGISRRSLQYKLKQYGFLDEEAVVQAP